MKQYVHRPGTNAYKLLERKANSLGADKFGISRKKDKKYFVIYNNKTIHFGSRSMSDFTFHKDEDRRSAYRSRHGKIVLKDGRLAYKVKESPAHWSWNILW